MRRFFTVALTLACLGLLVGPPSASAQGSSAAPSSDSTTEEARHLLPFWLDKVPEEYRGQVPLPIGISVNYVHQVLPLAINDPVLVVGGVPLPPGFVQGGSLKAVTNTLVARADVWILPFLNVYGTVAHLSGDANDIRVDLAAPVPIPIPSQVSFSGSGYGVGFTAAFGYRAFFISYDVNWNWAKPDVINRVRVQVQGPRVGVLFVPWGVHGKVYGGAMRLAIAGHQTGSVSLGPGVPLDRVGPEVSLAFDLQARPENAWSPLAGAEFEITRHVMLVAEGAFGKTSQVLLSTGYRF
jgi:hypothetical protein